jgi:hypothetical protein
LCASRTAFNFSSSPSQVLEAAQLLWLLSEVSNEL